MTAASSPAPAAAFVVATAGHVDHGKSTLVRALTGMNPDRLREEQEREMTIDLGFAWLTLPDGASVGLVDVPGHIDFIENMLAGVGGIDAALIVVAADEGLMPQTREHLAILDLLRVPRAVAALTKIDLAPDPAWIDLVGADLRAALADTGLAGAPIVPVSARTGQGLPGLLAALQAVLRGSPRQRDRGRPRLPVDRAFSVAGFGTVVTGTLLDGALSVGDEVEILPQRLAARVRGLQTHKQKLEQAQPGSRVAINLSGVPVEQVARGSVVARPGLLSPSALLDARVELLPAARSRPQAFGAGLKHNAEVKFFCGTREAVARLRLLEGAGLSAGQAGWAQLELAMPVAVAAGDRFILRLPSPSLTVGGGTVVDPNPARRYRRRAGRADAATLARLAARLEGAPAERLESALQQLGFATLAEAAARAGLTLEEAGPAAAALADGCRAAQANGVLALLSLWEATIGDAAALARAHHAAQPLADGMPRESLRSRLQLSPPVFNALMQRAAGLGALAGDGDTVRAPEHQARFAPDQQRAVDALLAQCRAQPFNTPLAKDCRAAVGDAVYEALLRRRQLVQVSPEVVFLADTYDAALQGVRDIVGREGQITVARFRDAFGTTRKYALGLLEHLDQIGLTKRVGDARVLR